MISRAAPGRARRTTIAVVLVAFGALLATIFALTRAPSRGPAEVDPRESGSSRANAAGEESAQLVEPADSATSAAQPAGAAAQRVAAAASDTGARDAEDADPVAEVDALVAALRHLAPLANFHARAWKLVAELDHLVRRGSETDNGASRAAEQVAAYARDALEPARVRAGCLLALVADRERSRPLAEAWTADADPELARAGWLVCALGGESAATELSLATFSTWKIETGRETESTWPAVLTALPGAADLERGGNALGAPWIFGTTGAADVAGLLGGPAGADFARARRAAVLTREIVLLTTLGLAACESGAARDALFELLVAGDPGSRAVRSATAFALAHTTLCDAESAKHLARFVRATADGDAAAELLSALLRVGQGELALDLVGSVLPRTSTDPVARAKTMQILAEMLDAPEIELARGALLVAQRTALDPAIDEDSRRQLLVFVRQGDEEFFLELADELLRTRLPLEAQLGVLSELAEVSSREATQVLTLIRQTYLPTLDLQLRTALVSAVPRWLPTASEFLEHVARVDPDPTLRTRATRN